MRKSVWLVVLPLIVVLAAPVSGGCLAATLCDGACNDYNALGCGTTCDCSACVHAPPECDSYYRCIRDFSGSCVELLVACPIPAQCDTFISANCH